MRRWYWLAFAVVLLVGGVWYLFYAVESCNIGYIKLHGYLTTYIPDGQQASSSSAQDQTSSENVVASIRRADADSRIEAIILEVDSGGGQPVAGEEIEAALLAAHKPTLALIRSMGDSAAYMAASGANTIMASAFSDVGDIGITQSYVDNAAQNRQNGITFNQLSIGAYKDMFNPDKPLTPAERKLALSELQIAYDRFVDIVATNRRLATSTVYQLADGSSYTGEEALSAGLIDAVGNDADAETRLANEFGMRRARVCSF